MSSQQMTAAPEGDATAALSIRPPNRAVRIQVDRATRKAYHAALRAGHRAEGQEGPEDQPLGGSGEMAALRESIAAGESWLAQQTSPGDGARAVALAMREDRRRLHAAASAAAAKRPTAEAVAAQAGFEQLLVLCVYDATGSRLFRSAEHYRRVAGEPLGHQAARAVARAFYYVDESEPPEERFLREHPLAP